MSRPMSRRTSYAVHAAAGAGLTALGLYTLPWTLGWVVALAEWLR